MNENEKILNLAETILKEEEEIIFPVIKLHELILEESLEKIEFEQFVAWLFDDMRFEIIDSASTQEPWPDEEDEDMRKLGYYKGPRVYLAEKKPSKEQMLTILQEKMQRTMNALNQAYSSGFNELDEEEEKQLIHVISKTKDLQNKINDAFENEPEKN